jgi:hypothetical protein
MSYTMIDGGRAICCSECGSVSYNRNDIAQKYCCVCRVYHTGRVTLTRAQLIERGYTEEPGVHFYGTTADPTPADDCPAPDTAPDCSPSSSEPSPEKP